MLGLGFTLNSFSFVALNLIMPENSSENRQWTDPKDFGLPYVEVTPITPLGEEIKLPEKEEEQVVTLATDNQSQEKSIQETEPAKEAVVPTPAEEVKTDYPKEEHVTQQSEELAPEKRVIAEPEKKKNSWVVAVVILALLVVSVIVWQLMSQGNGPNTSGNQVAQQQSPPEVPVESQVVPENTPTEEIQTPENQDSIPKSNSSLEEPVETPQTGTTIDRTVAESLIRVESRGERPQYFIVVGSLPNERMALSESTQYLDRASSVYLILPYEDVKNYRLAIGSFTSFRKASEELNAIKDQYTEALWILKY
ncbi:hypothetical protein SAMN05444394_1234 [Algoriphagus halophilus]|uniref:Sporulation related domain-containing protein n=2 Tax=Algoriphagus halophilus TaxID=226505 RepID=A0A1N6DPH7_9BACT|nr:hypothetical protein SAMN05444394_1234 [Algoriphagus halophilus]